MPSNYFIFVLPGAISAGLISPIKKASTTAASAARSFAKFAVDTNVPHQNMDGDQNLKSAVQGATEGLSGEFKEFS